MVKPIDSIVQQALGLTESDRALVIRRLIESLDGIAGDVEGDDRCDAEGFDDGFFRDPQIKQAWDDEIRRRIEKMDRGEAKMIPGDEVRRRIRKMMDERVDR